ncbi:MAG: bifunctional 2-C-methyl-D-erythritol 4-phosphate cytidylyltransferase/2-C-methyl-D-erythritol 2,4-cyclodiphosphate synthase [Pseudomonadota bacterium]|nr:bifunctional 2-C-methyl-D-erythritol 4-phosphate cytidylyltransferase/2-C-methyl-D-erythritol 2,4-cyclodiphosphate synthase [Pseudomonadota bacterium]
MARPRTAALIVAAGRGERSGSPVPKQFALIGGKPMIAHSYAALSTHSEVDRVLVVTGADQMEHVRHALGDVAVIVGGASRRESVRNGLEGLSSDPPARVLIHDAARPFLSHSVIDRLLAQLDAYQGAIPALPVADTLVHYDGMLGDTVARDGLYRVQTPQAFVFDAVLAAHRVWPLDREATDDAQMVRDTGHEVTIVEGDITLEKITHPADFALADARYAAAMISRTASGFDVHRLVAGEELWLGGIRIPHDKGLSGHSDADVALHALTDALLGTIAAGDIGTHFPPSDPKWRGADSARFLEHAASLIAAAGGIIDFADLTILCEAPKIGPYRGAMRNRIAGLLRLDPGAVSVKATTTERLGFTGREEGIAAQATATVRVRGDTAMTTGTMPDAAPIT